jgi:hypothetical protein
MTSNLSLQDQRKLSAAKHALDFAVPGSVSGMEAEVPSQSLSNNLQRFEILALAS